MELSSTSRAAQAGYRGDFHWAKASQYRSSDAMVAWLRLLPFWGAAAERHLVLDHTDGRLPWLQRPLLEAGTGRDPLRRVRRSARRHCLAVATRTRNFTRNDRSMSATIDLCTRVFGRKLWLTNAELDMHNFDPDGLRWPLIGKSNRYQRPDARLRCLLATHHHVRRPEAPATGIR